MKLGAEMRKGWRILTRRLQEQGLWVTLQWMWGRGLSYVTGVPVLKYSRVTPQLYVGSQFNAAGRRALERAGISAVVNLRTEFDDAAYGLAFPNYCYLPTVDDTSPSPAHFQKGVDFIQAQIEAGGAVYVHCKAGVGRAPTMAAAYLISQGHSADEAIALIKQVRPFITITPPQMEALRVYEAEVERLND
ncbi:MAG: dual specificity protein phosphatase family protein [Caldilineaceae bacterium]|nr:dual specificity protein phosphatase family protein [Caldilineaceae bacterium]